ncbi:hypothetical protein RQP46_000707 [Phenoliferia psychrophenolica]
MEHHREESSSSSTNGFQTNSPPTPATYMPREGDWVLLKALSSDPPSPTTPARIFQLLESATKPDQATPLRALIGRAIVVHWDNREKAAELRNALPNAASIPVFTCCDYVTQNGGVSNKTAFAYEQKLSPNTRTLPPKAKRSATAEPTEASFPPIKKARVDVDVPDLHLWLTSNFELSDPPPGKVWTTTSLWDMHRQHVSQRPGEALLLGDNFFICVYSWCPGRVQFHADGVALNLRPRTVPLDRGIVQWHHSTYERNPVGYVEAKNIIREYTHAFPDTSESEHQIFTHFRMSSEHLDTFLMYGSVAKLLDDNVIVAGVSRRDNLPPLPLPLQPLPSLSPPPKIYQRSESTPSAEVSTLDRLPDSKLEDNDVPSDSERKPRLELDAPQTDVLLSKLSLREFIDMMKVRDPDRARSYDEALPILERDLIACDVLALVGASQMAAMGIKLGTAHRM